MNIIVIKVGSAVLVRGNGVIDYNSIDNIVEDIGCLKSNNYYPVLITSGAVSAGYMENNKKLSSSALSSIGQPHLMNFYIQQFMRRNINVAQLLITREDFSIRNRYLHLGSVLNELIKNNILPILNDNDVLHKESLSFSDNDQLASFVGCLLNATKVFFLSSVDGIYHNYEQKDEKIIRIIEDKENLKNIKIGKKTSAGTGGMDSKISSISLLIDAGIDSFVSNGKLLKPVTSILTKNNNVISTKILGNKISKIKGIRRWLLAGASPVGKVIVSQNGGKIITHKTRKSLLARGIIKVFGKFAEGDVISIYNEESQLIGFGVSKLSSFDISMNLGEPRIIVVHADHLYAYI